jgi:hypothetical protein
VSLIGRPRPRRFAAAFQHTALRHAVITAEQAVMLALAQGLDVREA